MSLIDKFEYLRKLEAVKVHICNLLMLDKHKLIGQEFAVWDSGDLFFDKLQSEVYTHVDFDPTDPKNEWHAVMGSINEAGATAQRMTHQLAQSTYRQPDEILNVVMLSGVKPYYNNEDDEEPAGYCQVMTFAIGAQCMDVLKTAYPSTIILFLNEEKNSWVESRKRSSAELAQGGKILKEWRPKLSALALIPTKVSPTISYEMTNFASGGWSTQKP